MTRFALAMLVLLLAAGCDSTDDDPLRVNLTPGSRSSYAVTYSGVVDGVETVFESGDVVATVVKRGETITGQSSAGGERTLSSVTHLYLSHRFTRGDETFEGGTSMWYRERDDRLEEVAYSFAGGLLGITGLKRPGPFG